MALVFGTFVFQAVSSIQLEEGSCTLAMPAVITRPVWISGLETRWGIKIPSWKTSLSWILGLIVLSALSIYNVVCICSDYQFNNVATRVDIITLDKQFRPPQVVALIPLYKQENQEKDVLMRLARHVRNGTIGECEICKILTDKGWDVWNDKDVVEYIGKDLVQYYYALSLAFTRKLFRMMDAGAGHDFFTTTSSIVDEATFSAALNYVILHSDTDDNLKIPEKLVGMDRLFEETFPKEKYKMDLLRDRLLQRICQGITFIESNPISTLISGHPLNTTCHERLKGETIIFASEGLYISLPSSLEPKIKEYVFGMRESIWISEDGAPDKSITIFPDTSSLYSSTIDKVFSSHIFQTSMKRDSGLHLTVGYCVKLRTKETRYNGKKCYQGPSPTVCFVNCTKKHIIQRCGCIPFIFERLVASYYPGLPYCSLRNYKKCNVTEIPALVQDHCMDHCKASCEHTSYTWHTDSAYYELQRENLSAELKLQLVPSFNTFAELLWVEKNTQEQFLAQIGGTINLYLGYSGVTVIGFVLVCFDFVKKWRKTRSMPVSADRRGTIVALAESSSVVACSPTCQSEWRREISEIKDMLKEMRADLDLLKR